MVYTHPRGMPAPIRFRLERIFHIVRYAPQSIKKLRTIDWTDNSQVFKNKKMKKVSKIDVPNRQIYILSVHFLYRTILKLL